MLIVVGRNRRDVRLLNLMDRRVVAETLVDTDVVVEEMTAGKVHDLLFRDLRHTVELPYYMLPVLTVDEGVLHHLGAVAVTAQPTQHIELLVGKNSFHQVLIKLAALEFLYLSEHEVTHLFELLSLLGFSLSDERRVVGQAFHARTGIHHLHRLVEVNVHESCFAVGKKIRDEAQCVGLVRSCLVKLPAEHHVLGFLTDDSGVDMLFQVGDWRILGSRECRARLPTAKVLVDGGYSLVGIEVTGETDGHIVGDVVAVEIVLDVDDTRILQVLLRTDGRLCTIRMSGIELFTKCGPLLTAVVGQTNIILLIHCFQLSVEATDDHVLEAVGLNLCPRVNFVVRNVLLITGDIVARVGVAALRADGCHHLVVLVGDVVFGGELRERVDFLVPTLTCCGVGDVAILLKTVLDRVEKRLLGSKVRGAEMSRALEHQMLKIVGQTCGLLRVVA